MVEEIIKGAFELEDSDLGKLDRLAEKAKKILAKAKKTIDEKPIEPKGKPAIVGKGSTPFAKFFDRVEKQDQAKKGKKQLSGILESDLGTGKARQAISFFNSPQAFFTNMLTKQLPILGGLIAAKEMAEFIVKELIKKGGLLDRTFRQQINNLRDALRNKETQQQILGGFTQVIITSQSGETTPRNSYNSFDVFNQNQELLEDDFKVRNTRGLD